MARQSFMAYENNEDFFQVDHLAIQNSLVRITISGSLELTKDSVGLEHALKLKRVVDAAIDAMRRDKNLPDQVSETTNEIL